VTVLVALGEAHGEHAGRVLSVERGRTVLVFDSVGAAVSAAARLAGGGAAVGLAVGELTTEGDWWAGPAYDVAEALAQRARRGPSGEHGPSGRGSGSTAVTGRSWPPPPLPRWRRPPAPPPGCDGSRSGR